MPEFRASFKGEKISMKLKYHYRVEQHMVRSQGFFWGYCLAFLTLIPSPIPTSDLFSRAITGWFINVAEAEVAPPSPRTEIKETLDKLVEVVEQFGGKERHSERQKKLREIIQPKFDFAEMSIRCLGNLWKEVNEQQKVEFREVFSELLARTYLSRIETIERGMVAIDGENIYPVASNGESRGLVRTIVTHKGDKFPIIYKVVYRDNQWRVYDVVIENVGLVANYRNEFSGIIRREGFPKLMERLREKVAPQD
jgi:phospholipid transport system substrate-binding protein